LSISSLENHFISFFIMFNRGFNRRGQNSSRSRQNMEFQAMQAHQAAKRNARQINSTGVFQVQKNKQMVSIPSSQPNLKIRKWIRTQDFSSPGPVNGTVGTTGFAVAVRLALTQAPIAATDGGEQFTIYGLRVYCVPNSGDAVNLDLSIFDPNQTVAASNLSNIVGAFTDSSSSSGIAHISLIYPINGRPSWNTATADTRLFQFHVPGGDVSNFRIVVDADVSYIRSRPPPLG
jgi:hypothetical protein